MLSYQVQREGPTTCQTDTANGACHGHGLQLGRGTETQLKICGDVMLGDQLGQVHGDGAVHPGVHQAVLTMLNWGGTTDHLCLDIGH